MAESKSKKKKEPKVVQHNGKQKRKILLVDDEPNFVEACKRTFEANNYTVTSTDNKEQAQELMHQDPDIVVIGTITPAGEAFQLHQWMKSHSRYKDMPLVVIDAKYEERPIRGWRWFEGMQLEADEYVSKPIEPASLAPRIHSLLEQAMRMIKVLVVDDHTMVRNGICAVLALQKDIEVIGEADNGKDAIDKVARLMPNVTLMDIVMPVMSGLEATKQISKNNPDTKVLILTQFDDEENMFVAKQAGAQGFIPKKAASSDLITGIKAVDAGRYFPKSFAYVTANWKEGLDQ